MKFISLFSGIEAATVAWKPLGWDCVAVAEIEKFPSAVLSHHYPDIENVGDVTNFKQWNDYETDVIVGGSPCQSFSVAGLRKGLDDPRGNLMLTFGAIAGRYRPRWLVWENVPGVLSSAGGQDFASFLGLITGQQVIPPEGGWSNSGVLSGYKNAYGVAWRILDAQYFGVPQRRRRVFVVGYLGDWRRAAAVLFERHSLQGHTAPSRETRKDVASYTPGSIGGYDKKLGTLRASGGDLGGGSEFLIKCADVAPILGKESFSPAKSSSGKMVDFSIVVHGTQDPCVSDIAHALGRNNGGENCICFTQNDAGRDASEEIAPTLRSGGDGGLPLQAVAYSMVTANTNSNGLGVSTEVSPTLDRAQPASVAFAQNTRDEVREMPVAGALSVNPGMKQTSYIRKGMQVRRLTPIECERLQGFPDNFTKIPWRGKPAEECPSGHRYKALGNSMAVPVMRWIGERIEMVENVVAKQKEMK